MRHNLLQLAQSVVALAVGTALLSSAGLALVIVCSALLFPCLYSVFRFLHPYTWLDKLQDEIESGLRGARRHARQIANVHRVVAESIEHLANIAVRSIDRVDRTTPIESLHTLEKVAHFYWTIKADLPAHCGPSGPLRL